MRPNAPSGRRGPRPAREPTRSRPRRRSVGTAGDLRARCCRACRCPRRRTAAASGARRCRRCRERSEDARDEIEARRGVGSACGPRSSGSSVVAGEVVRRPTAATRIVAIACLNTSWSAPPTSTITAKRSKFLIRPSNLSRHIRIVTYRRSRRAKFRNTSWMFGCAAVGRDSRVWAIAANLPGTGYLETAAASVAGARFVASAESRPGQPRSSASDSHEDGHFFVTPAIRNPTKGRR